MEHQRDDQAARPEQVEMTQVFQHTAQVSAQGGQDLAQGVEASRRLGEGGGQG